MSTFYPRRPSPFSYTSSLDALYRVPPPSLAQAAATMPPTPPEEPKSAIGKVLASGWDAAKGIVNLSSAAVGAALPYAPGAVSLRSIAANLPEDLRAKVPEPMEGYRRALQRNFDAASDNGRRDLSWSEALQAAPSPGEVWGETLAPGTPETAVGRIGKTVGQLGVDLLADPINRATGGLKAASEAAKEGKLLTAAARSLGSAPAAAVYAPEIAESTFESGRQAVEAVRAGRPMDAIEPGIQAALTGGLGLLVGKGALDEARSWRAPRTLAEAAAQTAPTAAALDEVPPPSVLAREPIPEALPPARAAQAPDVAPTIPPPAPAAPAAALEALAAVPPPSTVAGQAPIPAPPLSPSDALRARLAREGAAALPEQATPRAPEPAAAPPPTVPELAPPPAAPAAAPIPRAAPPERRAKVQRGQNGPVDIEFETPQDKDLFSALGRFRRGMSGEPGRSPNFEGLGQQFGTDSSTAMRAAQEYRQQVMDAVRDLPEGEVLRAPRPNLVRPVSPDATIPPAPDAAPAIPSPEMSGRDVPASAPPVEPRFAYRARNVGEQGIPAVSHAQASLSEADVRRVAPSRTEDPQEVVRVDLNTLDPADYEVIERPGQAPWVRFTRELPEQGVERVGPVDAVDLAAASKAEPPVRRAVAQADTADLAQVAGLSIEQARKGAADVEADGMREFSPEAVAIKRAVIAGQVDVPATMERRQASRGRELPKDERGQQVYPGEEALSPDEREALNGVVAARVRELDLAQKSQPTGRRPILGGPGLNDVQGYQGTPSHKTGTALEGIPEGPKEIVDAIQRDKGNALELRVRDAILRNDDELGAHLDRLAGESGVGDDSFPVEKYAVRAAPGQRGLEGIGEDVPAREPARPRPEQAPLFRGADMLQPSEARVTEGREADGPVFRQEQDARGRAEAAAQQTLPAETPEPWNMTREDYAQQKGAPKPHPGFATDMSGHQANFTSDRAKAERLKENSRARREASGAFEKMSSEWERAVRDGVDSGRLKPSAVFAAEDFDADAYGIVADVWMSRGVDAVSPFRLRGMTDRVEYLRQKEAEFATASAERYATAPRTPPDAPTPRAEGVPRDVVAKAFPTGKITDHAEGGHLVTLPGDRQIRVTQAGEILYNSAAFRAGYGRRLKPGETIAGSWKQIDRGGLIQLAKDAPVEPTLLHESFHAAMDLALNDAERAAVLKRYGTEEKAADAYAKWYPSTQVNSWFSRILSFAKAIVRGFRPHWEEVFQRTRSGTAFSQSATLEPLNNRRIRRSEAITDFLERRPGGTHPEGLRNVPSDMLRHVLAVGDDPEVLRAIVGALPVDVMDFLRRKKFSPEDLFHNEAVLKDVLSVDPKAPVALGVDAAERRQTALLRVVADSSAKLANATNQGGGPRKGGPTSRALEVEDDNAHIGNIGEPNAKSSPPAAGGAPPKEPPGPRSRPIGLEPEAAAAGARHGGKSKGKPPETLINLDRIAEPKDVREIEGRVQEALRERGHDARSYRSWTEARDRAVESGLTEEDVKRLLKEKGSLSDVEIEAGRMLRETAFRDMRDKLETMRKLQMDGKDYGEAERAYNLATAKAAGIMFTTVRAGSEAGRALAIHRKMSRAMTEAEAARWRAKLADPATPQAEKYAIQKRLQQATILNEREQLLQRAMKDLPGADSEFAQRFLQTPEGDTRAIAALLRAQMKPSLRAKLFEVWINFILSGPPTQLGNVSGNVLTGLLKIPEKAIAGALDSARAAVTGRPRERFVGEAYADLMGIREGVRRGLHAMRDDWSGEVSADGGKLEHQVGAVGGRLGEIIRTPGRALSATDAFFKGVATIREQRSLAYRKARAEGKTGRALAERIEDILANIDAHPEIVEGSAKEASYQTFTTKLGKFGQTLKTLREADPSGISKVVLPFLQAPLNITKFSLERTPLNFLRIMADPKLRNAEEFAKPIMGTLVGLSFALAAKEGLVTGGGPSDPKENELLRATGWQPYSVKAGDQYYSFKRLEPFATIAGFAADMVETKSEKTQSDLVNKILGSITTNVTDKSFLHGLEEFSLVLSDPKRYASQWAKGMQGSIVPAFVARAAQAIDPKVRETSALDGSAIAARLPGVSKLLPEKRRATGEPIEREGSALERFASPFPRTTEKGAAADLERAFLAVDYAPSAPARSVTIPKALGGRGQRIELTDAELKYLRDTDERVTQRLRQVVADPRFERLDQLAQRRYFENLYRQAGDSALKRLWGQRDLRQRAAEQLRETRARA